MKYTMLVAHRYVGNWVSVVQSELTYAYTYSDYMKYTMLVAHRYVDNRVLFRANSPTPTPTRTT